MRPMPRWRLSSIRMTIASAVQKEMHIRQYGTATAYLNGELTERVFMESPDGMEDVLHYSINDKWNHDHVVQNARNMLTELKKGDKVYLMKKALYGIKQAGRAWFLTFLQ